ncbi:hypothetical protein C2845_PM02G13050 [Panicum miliaceum]|uniref:BTB domain-containing protein n=1 Tax=Panicum miliaceum TaxID=4540 RepID=A0A3L6SC15_PANMI|nr:hypothetical protein C2845_PM02G13050 [Panicum miliaceum]
MMRWGCDAVRQLAHIAEVSLSGGGAREMHKEDTRDASGSNLVICGQAWSSNIGMVLRRWLIRYGTMLPCYNYVPARGGRAATRWAQALPPAAAWARTRPRPALSVIDEAPPIQSQTTTSTQGRKTLAAMAPPPGFDAGNGVTAPSRSAIIGGSAAGHHLLDIEGYSHTKDYLPTGQCIKSRPFTGVAEAVEAQAKFSLLDQTGEPVPSHSQMTKMHKYLCTGDGGFGYRDFINRAWLEESGHLKNDCFSIRCDVFVPMELRTEDRAVDPVFVTVPPYDLHLHLERLLAAKTGADVTFEVGGETFRAHRCILAARSTVFEAELFGQMKESVDTTVIRVDDMEADVFRALLGFMYTDGLPACPALQQAAMSQHLLVAADRYNLERLKLICEDNLCVHIDTGSVATILALAEQHRCRGLKEACFDFLSSPSTLNAVMATDGFEHLTRSCPAVLKELMSNIAARVP